jgi:transposase-like protein
VLAFRGNVCEAARQCGVHRNTVRRCLIRAGYDHATLYALAKATGIRRAA